MRCRTLIIVLMVAASLSPLLAAKERKTERLPAGLIGWIYLEKDSNNLLVPESDLRKETRHLTRGTICPVFKTTEKRHVQWAQVRAFDFDAGHSQVGWLEVGKAGILPPQTYPADADLLRALGSPFLDDFAAEHTNIARFEVRQGKGLPLLVCYVFTEPLAIAKLVAFTLVQAKYVPGPPVDYSINEMKSGIRSLEIRDLVGNGNECLITREPFREGLQTQGTYLVIRRVDGDKLPTVWQAPVEFRNLSRYSPKIQILQPPESNIGRPGTLTTGDVTFRPHGKGEEPVWKGTVEFFVVGREKALDSLAIEKACPWDGKEFTPLR